MASCLFSLRELRFGEIATEALGVQTPSGWWTGSKSMKESQTYTRTFAHADARLNV